MKKIALSFLLVFLIATTTFSQSKVTSAINSTTIALSAGETYTGVWEDVTAFAGATIAVKTDQNGTCFVQFSPDGINQDVSLPSYYRTNQIEPPHRYTLTRKYMRIVFTNTSAEDQTFMRLQTTLGSFNDLNVPLDGLLAQDFDAISVRPTDYHYEIALGLRQGKSTWNKFGHNDDVDVGTETVWTAGGLFQRLDTPSTLSIVSTDADDSINGTGAHNLILYYLDSTRHEQQAVIPLNGTTPLVTAFSVYGINRLSVYNSGTSDSNEGTINVTAVTGGTTQGQIAIGEGTTNQSIFFTQTNHTMLMDWLYLNVNKTAGGQAPKVIVNGWVYSFISDAKYLVYQTIIDTSVENTVEMNPSQPFIVGEESIFWLEATTDKADTEIHARFSGIEIRNIGAE